MLHTGCALTHLDEAVRRDALALLELLVEAAPEACCAQAPALGAHFTHLLAPSAQAAGGGVIWRVNRLTAVMAALTRFLDAWHSHLTASAPGAAHDADNATSWTWRVRATSTQPLHAHRAWGIVAEEVAQQSSSTRAGLRPPPAAASALDAVTSFARLWPRLAAVLAHTVPSLGEPTGCDAASVDCVTAAVEALASCQRASQAALHLLPRSGPIAVLDAAHHARLSEAEQEMAAAWDLLCPLFARFFPASASVAAAARPGAGSTRGDAAATAAMGVAELNLAMAALVLEAPSGHASGMQASAIDFLDMALRGTCTAEDPLGTVPPVRTPPGALLSLLRCAEDLLLASPLHDARPRVAASARLRLLGTITHVWTHVQAQGREQTACLAILRRLLASAAMHCAPDGSTAVPPDTAVAWLMALPKLLFELRHKAPLTSESAIGLLSDCATARCTSSPQLAQALRHALCDLEPQLAPLFALPGGATLRPGPFLRLSPPRVQHAALSLICTLPRVRQPTLRALALCCGCTAADEDLVYRAAEAVSFACGVETDAKVTWLVDLLLGAHVDQLQLPASKTSVETTAALQSPTPWQQRCGHIRTAVICLGCLGAGEAAMESVLTTAWPASCDPANMSRHACCGILELIAAVCRDGNGTPLPEHTPALIAHTLRTAAQHGALSVPPVMARTCTDAHDPGAVPVMRLLARRPSLVGPVMQQLALAEELASMACILDHQDALPGVVECAGDVRDAVASVLGSAHIALARHIQLSMDRALGGGALAHKT